tara:strand:+ start:367 stop:1356 length:990 start_codon:yes stop_codon:yes gene_type:complete
MFIVTASSLNTYSSCPRKYQYKYMEEFESTLPQDALLIGSAVHIGIEHFWLGKTAAEMFEAVDNYYRETPNFWNSDKGEVEKVKITAYLYGYIKERAEMLPLYEVLGVEEKWSETLHVQTMDMTSNRAGKFDLVLRRKSDGEVFVVDHKTSAARDIEDPMSVFWGKLTFDTQVVMYLDGAQRKYGLDRRPRFVYDVIRKTKSKPSMTKRASRKKTETKFQFEARKAALTETLPQFRARMMKEYTTDPSRFMWREILITHDEVERRQDELFLLEKQIQSAPLQYDLPRNPNSCLSAWGACPFFPVCAGQDDLSTSDQYRYKPAHSELKDS